LTTLKAEFLSSGGTITPNALVTSAETIMQAEHAAWLTELITTKT